MKQSFLKVGGLFLPITSPVLVTFTRFLACTFKKVWSTSASKSFYRRSYIFETITHLLMDKWFPWLALKYTSKHNPWGLNGTKHWRFFIVEHLQPNKLRKNQTSLLFIKFPAFFGWKVIYENVYNGLHKSTGNYWSSL